MAEVGKGKGRERGRKGREGESIHHFHQQLAVNWFISVVKLKGTLL